MIFVVSYAVVELVCEDGMMIPRNLIITNLISMLQFGITWSDEQACFKTSGRK